MKISNLGIYYINIESQINDDVVSIAINPYSIVKPPSTVKADIIISTNPNSELCNNYKAVKPKKESLFIIDKPGEYDIQQSYIQILDINEDEHNTLSAVIDTERIKIGVIGFTKDIKKIEKNINFFNNVDILIIPTGGGDVLDPENALTITNQIEPRVVIPVAYKDKNIPQFKLASEPVDSFIKQIGEKNCETTAKLKIKEESLPQNETKTIIISGK